MRNIEFELPHTRLAGFTNDNYTKPVLLALHGWMDNAGSFELMLPYLDNFHVISLDFPGHGLSPHRSRDAHYHFIDWAYDICLLIESQGWEAVTLVGHSMGGMVGNVVASAMPAVIKQLVLIDSMGFITAEPKSANEQFRNALRSRKKFSVGSKGVHNDLDSALLARVAAGGLPKSAARILLKRGVTAVEGGYIWCSDQRLRTVSAYRFSFEQGISFIESIECPVLLIHGDYDSKMMDAQRERFEPYYPDLTTVQMPGGHHCHMEYPQQAAVLVTDFALS